MGSPMTRDQVTQVRQRAHALVDATIEAAQLGDHHAYDRALARLMDTLLVLGAINPQDAAEMACLAPEPA
jgi:hypothetical protein